MPCTDPIITMLEPLRWVVTGPTWKKMLTRLRGTLLARGRRTVTTALWSTGQEQDPNFSAFHPVLNRARWSPLQASRYLLKLIIDTFGQAGGSVEISVDETLERRWGSQIRKRGHYRDTTLSSHERSVSSPGLGWIVLALVVRVPWTRATMGPPFSVCTRYHPTGQCACGNTPQNPGDAHPSGRQSAAALAARSTDQAAWRRAYSVLELGLHCARQQVTLIAPFRLDSMIHQPAPVRGAHTIGRPRVVGERLPSLEQVLQDPYTVWEQLTVDWYGEGARRLEWCTGTAWWYRFGSTPLPSSTGAHA